LSGVEEEMSKEERVCVVLMTYGSPATLDDIPEYLRNIRGGRDPDDALVAEFRRRYELIGGSPLIPITRAQAAALEKELNGSSPDKYGDRGDHDHPRHTRLRHQPSSSSSLSPPHRTYRVVAGMRFSKPLIDEVVAELAPGSQRVVGIIMSPQYSPIIMSGYVRALEQAVAGLQRPDLSLCVSGDWHMQPLFLQALTQRVTQALERFLPEVRGDVQVLLTAHSMPKRVIENEAGYIDGLKETAAAVARMAGLPEGRWSFCYQSAGHTPEEWLKPDFADVMPELRRAGHRHVLIAPVQFLADHLEILYDIEIGAREQAEAAGMGFARIESLNTSPLFIRALAAVVRETLDRPSPIR
jgi:protoporphyrin/coproporphyrin ferrochelatase